MVTSRPIAVPAFRQDGLVGIENAAPRYRFWPPDERHGIVRDTDAQKTRRGWMRKVPGLGGCATNYLVDWDA